MEDTWDLAYPQAFSTAFKEIIEEQLQMVEGEKRLGNMVSYASPLSFVIHHLSFVSLKDIRACSVLWVLFDTAIPLSEMESRSILTA